MAEDRVLGGEWRARQEAAELAAWRENQAGWAAWAVGKGMRVVYVSRAGQGSEEGGGGSGDGESGRESER
jgi:hypothetical protein